jgi:hypothetical protein
LASSTIETGLVTEAALNYYESMRMSKINNYTASDPNTLNLDLDTFSIDYSSTLRRMLDHLKDILFPVGTSQESASNIGGTQILPAAQSAAQEISIAMLHRSLLFYDIQKSLLYRLSMSNPLHHHVSPHTAEEFATTEKTKGKSKERQLRKNSIPESQPVSQTVIIPKTKSTAKIIDQRGDKGDLIEILAKNRDVTVIYKPILDLMYSAFDNPPI